jgi:cytoskeletal protein RodZ
MSQKKKVFGVILLLIIYVVIAAAGFFVAYYVKINFMEPQVTTKPQITPATVSAPSGYQTYENKEQKFSMQYPEELTVKENPVGFGVNTIEMRKTENADPEYAPDIQILTVPKVLAKTIGQDFESYYDMAENNSKVIESPLDHGKKAENFTKVRNREINGLRALDYSSVPSPNTEKQKPEIGTFVEAGDNLLIFASGSDSREQLEEVLKTFNYNQ